MSSLFLLSFGHDRRLFDSGAAVTAGNGVHLGVPLELELLAKLLADGSLDGLQDVGEDTEVGGVVLIVVTTLEDTSADQAGVPAVHVTTADVGSRVVTNHVDVLGETVLVVDLLHPRLEDLIGVGVGGTLGLAVDDTLQVDTGESLVLSLNGDTEKTLGETRGSLVVGRHDQVTLREVDRNARGDGVLSTGQQLAVLGEQEIQDQLHVGSVVTRVGKDQDRVELHLGEVAGLGLSAVFLCEVSPGRHRGVPGDNVLGVDDVLEAIVLRDLTDLLALTTEDKHRVVVLSQCLHWGVRLDELVGRDGNTENLGELLATGSLGLTTTVGEQNVRNLDAQLVVTVEHLQGLLGRLNGMVTVSQDTIDVESKGHVLGRSDLLLGHVLDLRGQEIAGHRVTISGDHGCQTRHTRRSGDREGGAEGVARATTVPCRRSQAQVVHVLGSIADGAAGCGDLNGGTRIVGDGQRTRHAATAISGGASSGGRSSTGRRRGGINSEVSVVEARHCGR